MGVVWAGNTAGHIEDPQSHTWGQRSLEELNSERRVGNSKMKKRKGASGEQGECHPEAYCSLVPT